MTEVGLNILFQKWREGGGGDQTMLKCNKCNTNSSYLNLGDWTDCFNPQYSHISGVVPVPAYP